MRFALKPRGPNSYDAIISVIDFHESKFFLENTVADEYLAVTAYPTNLETATGHAVCTADRLDRVRFTGAYGDRKTSPRRRFRLISGLYDVVCVIVRRNQISKLNPVFALNNNKKKTFKIFENVTGATRTRLRARQIDFLRTRR